MGSQLLAVILLLQLFRTGSRAVDQKADENAGSCWSIGFTHETCCGSEHGPEGNTECWDDVYTFESCCLGRDLKEAGCDSGFFTRFRGLVWEYYKEHWAESESDACSSYVLCRERVTYSLLGAYRTVQLGPMNSHGNRSKHMTKYVRLDTDVLLGGHLFRTMS